LTGRSESLNASFRLDAAAFVGLTFHLAKQGAKAVDHQEGQFFVQRDRHLSVKMRTSAALANHCDFAIASPLIRCMLIGAYGTAYRKRVASRCQAVSAIRGDNARWGVQLTGSA
jgi:hypothetical protein